MRLTLAGIALALTLAGCASTLPSPIGESAPSAPAAASVPSTTQIAPPPVFAAPGGPLTAVTGYDAGTRNVVAIQPPADLWARIRAGFMMRELDSPLVHQQEQWYASRPDYIERMTDRSRKYLFHIV